MTHTKTPKEIKIKTPYGDKNWSFVKRCIENHDDLLEACKIALARILAIDEQLNNTNTGRKNHAISLLAQAISKAERSAHHDRY